jgi:hypothetical protein
MVRGAPVIMTVWKGYCVYAQKQPSVRANGVRSLAIVLAKGVFETLNFSA